MQRTDVTAMPSREIVIFAQTDMEETNKKRGCNMSASEKVLLVDLVVKYSRIIENKKKQMPCWHN